MDFSDASGKTGADVAVGIDYLVGEFGWSAVGECLDGLMDFAADGFRTIFR